MTRFPLLEQLRVERERVEAETTAPLRIALDGAYRNVRALTDSVDALARTIATPACKNAVAKIVADAACELRRGVMEAAARVETNDGIATIAVSVATLRFTDPDSLHRLLLDHWFDEAPSRSNATASRGVSGPVGGGKCMLLHLTIPGITRSHVIDLPDA